MKKSVSSGPHGVRRHLRGPAPAPNMVDFIREGRQERLLHAGVVAERFLQARPRQPHDPDYECALRQPGDKLGAETAGHHGRDPERRKRQRNDRQPVAESGAEDRGVKTACNANNPGIAFFDLPWQEQTGQDRHDGQRQHEGTDQSKDYRQGHRPEQLPFHALQESRLAGKRS